MFIVNVNSYPFHHKNLKFTRENITKTNLPKDYFDIAISISVIEHIGMGWYGDSGDQKGDLLAMKNIASSTKADGFIYITVPIGPYYRENSGRERIYALETLDELIRLSNLQVVGLEFYIPTKRVSHYAFGWIRATKNDVLEGKYLNIYDHAVACCCLQRSSDRGSGII